MPTPQTIYHSGKIYTVNPAQPWAEAVAVADGRILAVGADAEILALAGPETERVDLGGRLTLPGLCDAHIHFYNWSITRQEVELAATRSKTEMMDRIARKGRHHPARRHGLWATAGTRAAGARPASRIATTWTW